MQNFFRVTKLGGLCHASSAVIGQYFDYLSILIVLPLSSVALVVMSI